MHMKDMKRKLFLISRRKKIKIFYRKISFEVKGYTGNEYYYSALFYNLHISTYHEHK